MRLADYLEREGVMCRGESTMTRGETKSFANPDVAAARLKLKAETEFAMQAIDRASVTIAHGFKQDEDSQAIVTAVVLHPDSFLALIREAYEQGKAEATT